MRQHRNPDEAISVAMLGIASGNERPRNDGMFLTLHPLSIELSFIQLTITPTAFGTSPKFDEEI